jgi:hypothetical protein
MQSKNAVTGSTVQEMETGSNGAANILACCEVLHRKLPSETGENEKFS